MRMIVFQLFTRRPEIIRCLDCFLGVWRKRKRINIFRASPDISLSSLPKGRDRGIQIPRSRSSIWPPETHGSCQRCFHEGGQRAGLF